MITAEMAFEAVFSKVTQREVRLREKVWGQNTGKQPS